MVAAANMVEVAALVGDTARATMLAALMGGRSLTATELAFLAGVTRPTASEHLARMVEARLLAVTPRGRFRYYRIASPMVAAMLESLIAVAALEMPPRHQPRSLRDEALRNARSCYDHMAGRLGVSIADALIARGCLELDADGGALTDRGRRFLCDFGVRLDPPAGSQRIFCRACLDWSERRYHVAGLVGAELQRRCLDLGWIVRGRDTRALTITAAGIAGFGDAFGIDLQEIPAATARRTAPAAAPRPARASDRTVSPARDRAPGSSR